MSKISIYVEGQAGTGKSAIAQAIEEMLTEKGFAASLHFINDEHAVREPLRQEEILKTLTERYLQIEVIEIQCLREKL